MDNDNSELFDEVLEKNAKGDFFNEHKRKVNDDIEIQKLKCTVHFLEKQTYYFLGVLVGIIVGVLFLRGD